MDKTVVKAFHLIEALAHAPQPCGVAELARELGWTRSNAHRILDTLRSLDIVERVDGKYSLTLKLWKVGTLVLSKLGLQEAAHPVMETLSRSTGETILLSSLDERHVVFLDVIDSPRPISATTRIGSVVPVHCTATGKVLLAFAPDDVVAYIARDLERFTVKTITTHHDLTRAIDEIRKSHIAVVRDEWVNGISGVATPIFNGRGNVVAALGVTCPNDRFDAHVKNGLFQEIRQAGRTVSQRLGCF